MASSTGEQASTGKQSLHNLHRSIVTIFVGPEQYAFYVHRELVCDISPYFKTNLNSGMKESSEHAIILEHVNTEVFKIFEEWLYKDRFTFEPGTATPSIRLVQAFCLGQYLCVPQFQNLAINAIRDRATDENIIPSLDAIEEVDEHTAHESGLWKLLVDIYAYNFKPHDHENEVKPIQYPAQFIADVFTTTAKRLPHRRSNESVPDLDTSSLPYHVPIMIETKTYPPDLSIDSTLATDGLDDIPPSHPDESDPASTVINEPIAETVPLEELSWGVEEPNLSYLRPSNKKSKKPSKRKKFILA